MGLIKRLFSHGGKGKETATEKLMGVFPARATSETGKSAAAKAQAEREEKRVAERLQELVDEINAAPEDAGVAVEIQIGNKSAEELKAEIEELREQLFEQMDNEPEDENGEDYEEWEEQVSELEQQIEELEDQLAEFDED